MEWYVIGTSAAILTTFGFVPQIIKMHRTKSVKDVSIGTLFQISAGVILWTLYGIHINDTIVIAANAVTFIILAAAIISFYYYRS